MNHRKFYLILINFLFVSNLFGQNLSSQQFIEKIAKEERILKQKKAPFEFNIFSKEFFIERPNYQPIIKYVIQKKGNPSEKEREHFKKLIPYGSFIANFYWKYSEHIVNTKPGETRKGLYDFFGWTYNHRVQYFPSQAKKMGVYLEKDSVGMWAWLMQTRRGLQADSKNILSHPDFYYILKYASEPKPPKEILNYQNLMSTIRSNRGTKDQKFTIRRLNKAINNIKSIYKGWVYTGQRTDKDLHEKLKVGDFVTYGSFLSTSLDSSVAEHFRSKADSNHRLIIKSKKGRVVGNMSTSHHEKEVIFKLFVVWRVTKIKKIGRFFKPKYVIHFEEVPGKKIDKNTKKMTTGNPYVQKFFP